MARITLVTGGTRSGKSHFAKELALKYSGNRFFIATAQPFDDEMKDRILKHQHERGDTFTTIEVPYELAAAVTALPDTCAVALIDCLTVWLGNLMYRFENDGVAVATAVTNFVRSLDSLVTDVVIVTNEVGMGIVPDNALSRQFRDLAGILNREIAQKASSVYITVCGIPQKIK